LKNFLLGRFRIQECQDGGGEVEGKMKENRGRGKNLPEGLRLSFHLVIISPKCEDLEIFHEDMHSKLRLRDTPTAVSYIKK
jgi:hypothetical protein